MKIFKLGVIALVTMCGLNSCSEDCGHDFIEHDYTKDLLGTWSVLGPESAETLVIKADGTMESMSVHEEKFFESTGRYELSNNRMKMIWDDGTTDEGRLNVVAGRSFSLVIDEETGAGYYFNYCHEDFSDKLVGSWLFQDEISSQVWSYHADGTADWTKYYYNGENTDERILPGTYKSVGNILFDTYQYYQETTISYAASISITPSGDALTNTTLYAEGDEVEEYVMNYVRVKPSPDLAGKEYGYSDSRITNIFADDKDVELMGHTLNFANLDSPVLTMILNDIFFHVDFPDATHFHYSSFHAPIVVEGNKMTVKMSEEVPTFKDVVFYIFQSADCNQLHLCMDKTAFVNFFTNMQCMYMDDIDEQFDTADADAVDAIYNHINSALYNIKVSLVMHSSK